MVAPAKEFADLRLGVLFFGTLSSLGTLLGLEFGSSVYLLFLCPSVLKPVLQVRKVSGRYPARQHNKSAK
jgi:hypothetical protein